MDTKPEKIEEFREKENFPVASHLVPAHARRPIFALYGFARSADEISDNHRLSNEERREKLIEIYDGLRSGDINKVPYAARDYFRECRDTHMNIKHGLALLEAFIQDTEKKRYDNWNDTLAYCKRSAASIGRSVLEATGEFAADYEAADDICATLQLINHLQDVKEDYLNDNRIYFDATLINHEDIGLESETENFSKGKREIIRRLRELLYSGIHIFEKINSFRIRAEIATIYNVADMLLNKLEYTDILRGPRVELTKWEKRKALRRGVMWAFRVKPKQKYSSSRFAMFSKSSFLKPMLKLDYRRRKAMLCFYSFCRLVDDAADNAPSQLDGNLRLKQWRGEVEKMYSEDVLVLPNHPVSRELALYIKRYRIDKRYLLEIIEGQQMDISGEMVKPSDETLDMYCYRVASCVGLVSVQIFDYHSINEQKITEFAVDLGKALQLVNIMRDVQEDAKKGRVYLPKALLEKHFVNYPVNEIAANYEKIKVELAPVLADVAALADSYFEKTVQNLPDEERKNMRSALMMKAVYQNYLSKMRAKNFIFDKKEIGLTPFERITLFFKREPNA